MVVSRRTRSQRSAANRAYQVASCSGLTMGGLKTTDAPVELRWRCDQKCCRPGNFEGECKYETGGCWQIKEDFAAEVDGHSMVNEGRYSSRPRGTMSEFSN